MSQMKEVGQTQDAGFEIGVRKIFPVSLEEAWDFLFSDRGIGIWLGDLKIGSLEVDRSYKTVKNIEGMVKVFKPGSHIRLSWKKPEWTNVSTLQIRVISAKSGTTISFHQERLVDGQQRKELKIYWNEVLMEISIHLR